MTNEQKNYRRLVEKAEIAFNDERYLEAFLIQSCLFESVIKDFAIFSLKPIFESHPNLKQKSTNFELARLVDELFVANKIPNDLYKNLDEYRKKRNKIIHQILKFESPKKFEKELRDAYKLGRDMKGFIVDEMIERKKGMTHSQLVAKLERSMKEFTAEAEIVIPKHLNKIMKGFEKHFTTKPPSS